MIFRLAELFCGPDGLAWGANLAGIVKDVGDDFVNRYAWATNLNFPNLSGIRINKRLLCQ